MGTVHIVRYQETTDPSYASTAAQTFVIESHGISLQVLRGPCPRCNVTIDVPIVRAIVKGLNSTTTSPDDVEPVICTCEEPHEGRPEGRVGCGAYWNFSL